MARKQNNITEKCELRPKIYVHKLLFKEGKSSVKQCGLTLAQSLCVDSHLRFPAVRGGGRGGE